MDHTFSDDVYAIENLLPISPAAEVAFARMQHEFYNLFRGIASMYGVPLSYMGGYQQPTTFADKSIENPTHKWAVKIFQKGKKPAILGFDTACSFADAVSNLGRIASRYPVTYDQANRRYVGDGFFIAIEIKEIANEKNPANNTHQRRS